MRSKLEALSIKNSKLKNESCECVVLRGVSIPELYELVKKRKRDLKKILDEIKEFGFNVVRIPIHPGRYKTVENYLKYVTEVVDYTEKIKLYCILDWHAIGNPLKGQTRLKDQFVKRDRKEYYLHEVDLDLAYRAWKKISRKYGNKANVLFEVFNEPAPSENKVEGLDPLRWEDWKEKLNKFIKIIRKNSSNIVILSPVGWAYELDKVVKNPVKDKNIMYSVHPYPICDDWRNNFEVAKSLPLIVTEWGFREKTSNEFMKGSIEGYGKRILNYMEENGISWIAWCYDDVWSPRIFKKFRYKERGLTEWGKFLLGKMRKHDKHNNSL